MHNLSTETKQHKKTWTKSMFFYLVTVANNATPIPYNRY